MSDVTLDKILDMQNNDPGDRLNTVLGNGLKKILGEKARDPAPLPLWKPDYFNLHQTRAFKHASEEQKLNIVRFSSQALLEEALYIEQSGMAYAAKMSIMSETIEERMLYGLFAADETTHYHQVRQFLPDQGKGTEPGEFHKMLTALIEEGDRDSLVFIIQVILEGWGLTHYRSLAQGCQSEAFSEVLKGIVRDEARHHGSGVILCRDRGLPEKSHDYVNDILSTFFYMVQLGPQSVIESVEKSMGGLTRQQKIELFNQLGGQEQSQERLDLLKGLMQEDGFMKVSDYLDSKGHFKALRAEDCV